MMNSKPELTNQEKPCHLQRFIRDSVGASFVEYALFIAIFVGALYFSVYLIGYATRDTMSTVAQGMSGSISSRQIARTSGSLQSQQAEQSQDLSRPPNHHAKLWQLVISALLSIAAMVLWYLIYIKRNKRSLNQPAVELDERIAEKFDDLNYDSIFEKRQAIFKVFTDDMRILFENRLEVRHIMSKKLTTVLPRTSAKEIAHLMAEKRLRHVLVCEIDGKLVGVISDRDLRKTNASTAEQLMTAEPETVAPDTQLNPAVTQLVQHRISCLPVVENEILVGVLTTTDLMMTLQCMLQMLTRIASFASPPQGERSNETYNDEVQMADTSAS